METEKLIDASEVKKLVSVKEWFGGYLCTEQDQLAQAVVKMCIDEVKKIKPVNAVILPCKIGQRVWAIRNFKGVKHAESGIVGEMFFTKDMKLHIVVKYVARGEWGKTVFATKEEAEAALAKMDRKDDT